MKVLAPIALFAYKRLDHLKRTLDSLRANRLAGYSDLHIYCDGPRTALDQEDVAAVRHYVQKIDGFRSVRVVLRDQNLGLAESIIRGVTNMLSMHERLIVLEDDMETSPWFLDYMNDMLDTYRDVSAVASIHGYAMPIDGMPEYFFMRGTDCWGWATWRDRWQLFEPDSKVLLKRLKDSRQLAEFNAYGFRPLFLLTKQALGEIDSWYIRWHASIFLANKLTLHPGKSFIRNIGTDASGTHGDATVAFNSPLISTYVKSPRLCPEEIPAVIAKLNAWYVRNPVAWLIDVTKLLITILGYVRLHWRG